MVLNSLSKLHEVGIVDIFVLFNLKISLIQLFIASIRIQCTVTNFAFCIELDSTVINFHVIFIRICTKMPMLSTLCITGAALDIPDFTTGSAVELSEMDGNEILTLSIVITQSLSPHPA